MTKKKTAKTSARAKKSQTKKPARSVKTAKKQLKAGKSAKKKVTAKKVTAKKVTAKKVTPKITPKKKKPGKLTFRDKKLQEIRKNLIGQKESLLAEAEEALNTLPGQTVFPDMGDQATAETDRNFMLRLRSREQKLLKKFEDIDLKGLVVIIIHFHVFYATVGYKELPPPAQRTAKQD